MRRIKNMYEQIDVENEEEGNTYANLAIGFIVIVVILIIVFVVIPEETIISLFPGLSSIKKKIDEYFSTIKDSVIPCPVDKQCSDGCIRDSEKEECVTDKKCLKTDVCSKDDKKQCCNGIYKCNYSTGQCNICNPDQKFGEICCPKGHSGVGGFCCNPIDQIIDENGEKVCCPSGSVFDKADGSKVCCRLGTKYNTSSSKCEPMCKGQFFDIDTHICAKENNVETLLTKTCPWNNVVVYNPLPTGNTLLFNKSEDNDPQASYLFGESLSATASVTIDETKNFAGCNLDQCNAKMSSISAYSLTRDTSSGSTFHNNTCTAKFLAPKTKALTTCPITKTLNGVPINKCCKNADGTLTGKVCNKEDKHFCGTGNTCYTGYKYDANASLCKENKTQETNGTNSQNTLIECWKSNRNTYCPNSIDIDVDGNCTCKSGSFNLYGSKRCEYDYTCNGIFNPDLKEINSAKIKDPGTDFKWDFIFVPVLKNGNPVVKFEITSYSNNNSNKVLISESFDNCLGFKTWKADLAYNILVKIINIENNTDGTDNFNTIHLIVEKKNEYNHSNGLSDYKLKILSVFLEQVSLPDPDYSRYILKKKINNATIVVNNETAYILVDRKSKESISQKTQKSITSSLYNTY